jgi:hypothetical protein
VKRRKNEKRVKVNYQIGKILRKLQESNSIIEKIENEEDLTCLPEYVNTLYRINSEIAMSLLEIQTLLEE